MRKLKLILLLCLGGISAFAAQQDTTRTDIRKSTVTAMVEYSYNKSWGHFANIDAQTLLPINRNFEMGIKFQSSFKNVYTIGVIGRPKFILPVGELFIDIEVLYKAVMRDKQMDFVTALSLGYRFDYVSLQVGWFARVMGFIDRDWHSVDSYQNEPFNLLYRLELFCRPQSSNWNISAVMANYDDYQFERMWQPLFMLNGRYDVNKHWRIHLDAECKPTGMFHLNAAFYGATVRTGVTYRF